MQEDLDLYAATYQNDPFLRENLLIIEKSMKLCKLFSEDKSNYLELGIGHGITIQRLAQVFGKVDILEGSEQVIQKHAGQYPNVDIIHSFFEDFVTTEKYHNIGMGFILEHVDDPRAILVKYKNYLHEAGSIFVSVPNAASLHRLIGFKAGLLADIGIMSEVDRAFGHKRYWTYEQWLELFQKARLQVVRTKGLYLKPFTTSQIQSLNFDSQIYQALCDVAEEYCAISNACFFQLRNPV